MNSIRFIGLLFLFFGILASCVLAVLLVFILARFWPLLIAVLLACLVFEIIASQAGIEVPAESA
ncbi:MULTISPECIES: hypothetical protein [Pseudomonas]|uniref:Lipoprotein n=1 Tax=Pseudomonas fluorescens TaxID=294 RepID=A0A0D0SPA8_PSEFL|nr:MULTISPECIES: hypothetical protein [Pseudomonas fluorescens group]AZE62661.1 hypothetical protein C4K02_4316 [Pseudomonas synxantha]KIR23583.1 hypothetical protein PFLU3_09340 [Pseudomonas fluorescens]